MHARARITCRDHRHVFSVASQHAQHAQRHRVLRAGATGSATLAAGADAEEAAPRVLAGKTAAVVGGGPGGMLCAAHLARLGAAVEVFERHDPAAVDEGKPPPAVWTIGLAAPATRSVKAAGLNPDFGKKWRCVLDCRPMHLSAVPCGVYTRGAVATLPLSAPAVCLCLPLRCAFQSLNSLSHARTQRPRAALHNHHVCPMTPVPIGLSSASQCLQSGVRRSDVHMHGIAAAAPRFTFLYHLRGWRAGRGVRCTWCAVCCGVPSACCVLCDVCCMRYAVRCRLDGAAVHLPGQATRFVGEWASVDFGLSFSAASTQPGIVEHLRAECERVYPDSVTVSHGMRAVGGNVCTGGLVLEDSAGERHERQVDMVVGADGASSTVRKLMQEQVRNNLGHDLVHALHACMNGAL